MLVRRVGIHRRRAKERRHYQGTVAPALYSQRCALSTGSVTTLSPTDAEIMAEIRKQHPYVKRDPPPRQQVTNEDLDGQCLLIHAVYRTITHKENDMSDIRTVGALQSVEKAIDRLGNAAAGIPAGSIEALSSAIDGAGISIEMGLRDVAKAIRETR